MLSTEAQNRTRIHADRGTTSIYYCLQQLEFLREYMYAKYPVHTIYTVCVDGKGKHLALLIDTVNENVVWPISRVSVASSLLILKRNGLHYVK